MDQREKILLDKYLAGKANPAERAIVEQWFQQYYPESEINVNRNDRAHIFKDLDSRIDAFLPQRKIINYKWIQIAAVLFITLTLGMLLRHHLSSSASQETTYQEIRIPLGFKKQITLPDQSTVFLNSGSVLRIPNNFTDQQRKVILVGEGYFKIKRDTLHPFVIHSGQLRTTVLGTSFNIRAYPEDNNIQVAVTSGKVKIDELANTHAKRSLTKGITLNQILLYRKDNKTAAITQENAELISSWKNNLLYFDNASIPEIARTLERWYDIKVKVTGTSCDTEKRYTIRFNNEPIDKVLNGLSLLTNTSCSLKNKEVFINIKNCIANQ